MDISGLGVYSGIPLGLDSSFSSSDYRGRRGKAGVSFDLSRSTDSTGLHVSDEDKRLIRELQLYVYLLPMNAPTKRRRASLPAEPSAIPTRSGPDGRRYAIGGEVRIDASPGNTPEESLEQGKKDQSRSLRAFRTFRSGAQRSRRRRTALKPRHAVSSGKTNARTEKAVPVWTALFRA